MLKVVPAPLIFQIRDINSKTGATHYHAYLGLPDKGAMDIASDVKKYTFPATISDTRHK